jgi:membrane protease YdiL (CAAX protease family)
MFESKSIFQTIAAIFVISIVFAVLSVFKISYQFYLWEFYIDLKPLSLLVVLFFLIQQKKIIFSLEDLKIFRLNLKLTGFSFLLPIFLIFCTIGIGMLIGSVMPNKLENKPTLILGAIFDIPAIFVFSILNVFIEEIFFRILLFKTINRNRSTAFSLLSTNLLWELYTISQIIDFESFHGSETMILLIYFFALGIASSALFLWQNSIWSIFSFRIAFIIAGPFLLNSFLVETDPFFVSSSTFFFANGFVISIFIVLMAYFAYKKAQKGVVPEV